MQNQQNRQAQQMAQQQMMMQAIGQFAEIYAEKQQTKSDAKIYGELLKFAGPAIGDNKGELLANYKKMSEEEQANFGRTLFGGGLFPTMSQGYNFGRNAGIRAGMDNAANIAAGNQTFTGGQPDPGPVLMDGAGPTNPLPAVAGAPAPAATPAQTMPGGAQSKEAYNRWRVSQGLPPIP